MGTSLLIQWIRIHLLMQGHGFSSWSRKIPHAMGQLSPCTPTTEPMGCNAWSPSSTARKQPLLVAMLTPVLPTKMKWKSHSWAGLSATPWTAARQAPLSMGLSRQGYWRGLPCPPPGDLPDPGLNPCLLHLLHCRQILYCWATGESPIFMHVGPASKTVISDS